MLGCGNGCFWQGWCSALILPALCPTEAVLGFALGAGCGRGAGPALPPAASGSQPGRCLSAKAVLGPLCRPQRVPSWRGSMAHFLISFCSSHWWLEPASPRPTQLRAAPAPFPALGLRLSLGKARQRAMPADTFHLSLSTGMIKGSCPFRLRCGES